MKNVFLIGAAITLLGCEGRAIAPAAETSAPRGFDSVRIVEPRDGRMVHAGEAFLVRVEQQLAGGPLQGRGQVELSADGAAWQDLGPQFPWTRQGAEFATFATIAAPGTFFLRVRVRSDAERDPFLETDPVQVYSLGVLRSSPAPVASR